MATLRILLYGWYMRARRIITPGLRNAQFFYKTRLRTELRADVAWLDLGCGHLLLPEWMPGQEREAIRIARSVRLLLGIDRDRASLRRNSLLSERLCGDIEHLPLPDNSLDLVTANMVVEHVRDPQRLLSEVRRVLKPGGTFLMHTPNARGYATLAARIVPRGMRPKLAHLLLGRHEADVYPTYYRLNDVGTIRRLAAQAGMVVVELNMLETSAQTYMLGPIVLLELMWIRLLRVPLMAALRPNLVVQLRRPSERAHDFLEEIAK